MATVAPPRSQTRPDRHRVRRSHRRDARQHGTAAPQHARRAAPGAAHRRRGHLRGHAAPGLSAPLREKIGENVTPIQFIPYTDRMDYLAGMNMNLAYSLAVEKLCGMKLPEKANVIRVLIAEMNRIASHLVGMGAYGLDLGTFSPFLYAFREREMILDLFEEVCGARLTYSYITIGGVHDDLPPGWVERCREFLNYLKPRIPEYHALLTTNHIFVQRTANIGILSKDTALSYGCTGPMLRGSLDRRRGDPDWDLRKHRAVLRLRNLRLQRGGAAVRRSLGLADAARARSSATPGTALWCACWKWSRASAFASRRWTAIPPPRVAPHRDAASSAARRGLRRDGVPARPNGLLRRRRARQECRAAARASAVVEFLQSQRHQRYLPRLPHRRRARHRRQHRHCHGRD